MRLWIVMVMCSTLACTAGDDGRDRAGDADLTQRERDSILAQSRIPGARGVGAAMRAADSIEARLRRADSIGP